MPNPEILMAEARQARAAGRLDEAHNLYGEAAEVARAAGDPIALADALRHLSDLDREAGRADPALARAEEAVSLYRARRDTPSLSLANALRQRALALEASGRPALDAWREAGDLYARLDIAAGVAEAEQRLGLAVRAALPEELEPLARLWRQGWLDAHRAIVPEALVAVRTPENFTDRLRPALPNARVIGPVGDLKGFHLIEGGELNQFYLAASARGTGLAAVLMADAEARLTESGVTTAWLSCAVGNDRAARFYEKAGWNRARVETVPSATSAGAFPLETWRYEKALA